MEDEVKLITSLATSNKRTPDLSRSFLSFSIFFFKASDLGQADHPARKFAEAAFQAFKGAIGCLRGVRGWSGFRSFDRLIEDVDTGNQAKSNTMHFISCHTILQRLGMMCLRYQ